MKTFNSQKMDYEPKWYILDAKKHSLGRLASKVAEIVTGKNKPYYSPDALIGDFAVVINASEVRLTGNKKQDKKYYWHTGYPGGIRHLNYEEMVKKHYEKPLMKAIQGMLPKNKLSRKLLKRVKIYKDENHPHTAQQPVEL